MRAARNFMSKILSISPVLAFVTLAIVESLSDEQLAAVAMACSTEATPQGPAEPEPATSGALELTVEVTGTRPDIDGYDERPGEHYDEPGLSRV